MSVLKQVSRHGIALAVGLFYIFSATAALAAQTFYVDTANGDGINDGSSWESALKNIQQAINVSAPGDTIIVADGTYRDSITTDNKAITIQSVNGAEFTIIDGGGTSRCATLGSGSDQTATVLNGFTLTHGYGLNGGGVKSGTLNNCILTDNSAESGGGAYFSTLNNCTLIDNTADSGGGGAYSCALNNCTLIDNTATDFGGGGASFCTLNNCTLTGNTADFGGGGADSCTLNNCIVWGNTARGGASDVFACTLAYTCSSDGGTANGCITDEPLFVDAANGDYRLLADSPCAGMGDPALVEADTPMVDSYGKSIYTGGRVNMGAFSTVAGLYVDAANGNDSNDGSSWALAKKSIQAAIDVSIAGDTITVTNGTYAPITTANKTITIQSVNGAAFTTINGGGTSRCATLGSGSGQTATVLNGFTLTHGDDLNGGGVQSGTLNNCTLAGNAADDLAGFGGGAYYSTLNNCTLSGNSAAYGGGAHYCTLNNCTLTGNTANIAGGGADSCTLNNCIVWGNTARGGASDVFACTLSYTCSSDGGTDNGCITDEPLFVDAANGDYRLLADSPCAGMGNPALVEADTPMVDSYGKSIYTGGRVNMGAFSTVAELYVDAANGNDSNNGSSWALAKKSIQAAIDVSIAGDTITVTNGTYAPITNSYNLAITIQSVNGAKFTTIDGTLTPGYPAVTNRCATLGSGGGQNNTILNGFTLTNGAVAADGGGALGGTLNNCTLTDNTTFFKGGGVAHSTLNNCTLIGNTANLGGGAYGSTLNNCTLTGNTASSGGGGAEGSILNNCIVWGNTAPGDTDVYVSMLSYTCSGNGGTANGCIQADPLFVDAANGDYRLQIGSPCINAGTNDLAIGETDLDGNLRINYGTVDMGAYEYTGTYPIYYVAPVGVNTNDGLSLDSPKESIQNAIDTAKAANFTNALILAEGGIYAPITNSYNLPITISKRVSTQTCTIDGGGIARCALLGSVAGSTNTILNGFTLTNGVAAAGGGVYGGTLNHCILIGNRGTATGGGGVTQSMLNHCILIGNSASNGAGAYSCTLNNCILAGNQATSLGGGAYGGTLNNCTLVGNKAAKGGGASGSGTLNNCIVWGNTAASSSDIDGGTLAYTCSSDGTGYRCIQTDPQFVSAVNGDFRIRVGSPCIDTGWNSRVVGTTDFAGNARIQNDTVDMGAYEGGVPGEVFTVELPNPGGTVTPAYQVVEADGEATFTAVSTNRPFAYWLLDGEKFSTNTTVTVENTGTDRTLIAVFQPNDLYVDAAQTDDSGDGLTWATAKKSIQAAIDIAGFDAAITVTNGIYAPIIATNCFFTIQSVNGPDNTIIQGSLSNRCATLMTWDQFEAFDLDDPSTWADDVTLNGFTLTGGQPHGTNFFLMNGGGALGGALSNCVLTANNPERSGGGAARAILTDCTISGNIAPANGGGAVHSLLRNCIITGNEAFAGGGAQGSVLENCTVYGNTAPSGSGGGGISYCNLRSSIVWGNTPYNHADLFSNMIFEYSCTTPLPVAEGQTETWAIASTADDPLFVNAAGGNFRLLADSPCVGTGDPSLVEADTPMVDAYGKSIYTDGRVNMGAFSMANTFYVDAAQADDSGDGLTWATAKQSIQAAIDLTADGDTITVADGTYTPIITDGKAVTIQSVNGADVTIIDAAGARRCAKLLNTEDYDAIDWDSNDIPQATFPQSVLNGFTLANANSDTAAGAGALGGTLINCVVTNNVGAYGGGIDFALAIGCLIAGNTAEYGGGAENSVLLNCTVTGNTATEMAGGVSVSAVTNSIVWGNTSLSLSNGKDDLNLCDIAYSCINTNSYRTTVSDWNISGRTPVGNIFIAPLFVDADNGDFRLLAYSPCIGAGLQDGEPIDMGAFEGGYSPITFAPQNSPLVSTNIVYAAGVAYDELPQLPITNGMRQTGWYDAATDGLLVTTNSIVPGTNTTLYAYWVPATSYVLDLTNGSYNGSARHVLYETYEAEIKANIAQAGYGFQRWDGVPAEGLGNAFDPYAPVTTVTMPAANVSLKAVYVKNPGTVEVTFDPDQVGAASLDGLEWSIDGKVWFPADTSIRIPAGTQYIHVRSTDGRWLVPNNTRIAVAASTTNDAPQMVSIPVKFAPAFDEAALAADATDATSSAGLFADGQMQWTALQVGVRAKLGPLALQGNAADVRVASGKLPTGLKLVMAADGAYISGIPTKAGNFSATLRAKAGMNSGAALPISLTVDPLPAEYIGTFNGKATLATNGIPRNGQVTITVSSVGKFSFTTTLGGKRFTGKADAFDLRDLDDNSLMITNVLMKSTGSKPESYPAAFMLRLEEQNFGTFEFEGGNGEAALTGTAVRNGWKDKAIAPERAERLTLLQGYYTTLIFADASVPELGVGYLTLTVDKKGAVRASGKLADGTSILASTALMCSIDGAYVMLAVSPSKYKGGEYSVLLNLAGDTAVLCESRQMRWCSYAPNATADGGFAYDSSTAPAGTFTQGGYYSKLDSLYNVYYGTLDGVTVEADGLIDDTDVAFNATGSNLQKLTGDPQTLRLNAYPKTGLFSGTFKEGTLTRRVYGALSPWALDAQSLAGAGFYLVPETTPFKYNRSEALYLTEEAPAP